MFRSSILIQLLSAILFILGCGEDNAYIAEKVKFHIHFDEEAVQVSFELNPIYQVRNAKKYRFENFSTNFIRWDEDLRISEVGTIMRASPEFLSLNWPAEEISRLPNGKLLPASVPNSRVRQWVSDSRFFFWASPELISGGAVTNDDLRALPENFLATQNFYSENKTVEASISVLGPSHGNPDGGLYYFGNFGVNPFKDQVEETDEENPNSNHRTIRSSKAKIRSWELIAKEPAKVINKGKSRFWFF